VIAGQITHDGPVDTWRIEPLFLSASGQRGRMRGGSLPPPLARRFGAGLAITLRPDRPTIVSNFVSTLDGVVAFDTDGESGGREVSGGFAPDRFLMGLLRATADAVLVGAGTVRSGRSHVWTPGHVHPPSTEAFAAWRRQLGLPRPQPSTVIVSASGRIDPGHPGLHAAGVRVLIMTTREGSARIDRRALPPTVEVVVAGDHERVEEDAILAGLAERDLALVVCEGGPTLLGGLIGRGLVDELFLTIAPQVAGRTPARPRLSLVEGLGFEIGAAPWAGLTSVMRSGDHLFLRYRMKGVRGVRTSDPVSP
jgi:riboflavin biosynthesis pyrimidine reductase